MVAMLLTLPVLLIAAVDAPRTELRAPSSAVAVARARIVKGFRIVEGRATGETSDNFLPARREKRLPCPENAASSCRAIIYDLP